MKIIITLLLLTCATFAQELRVSQNEIQHKFFEKRNLLLFSYAAGGMTFDAVTTQHFLSPHVQSLYRVPPRELNPIAKPFVTKGWQGQFAASGISFAFCLGWSYAAHHWHHHKMEMLPPIFMGSISNAAAINNLRYYRER